MPTDQRFAWITLADLAPAGDDVPWLWHGYLRRGAVTLFTSQWKSGKTTLLAMLLARLSGAPAFLDRPVRPARAVVITEEAGEQWRERGQRLDLTQVRWVCRPFAGPPALADWLALLDHLEQGHAADPFDVLVIDPLASFLPPATEQASASALAALIPLQRFTGRGVAVLLLHHPKKGATRPGQAARGTGALSGFADILLEMNWVGRPSADDRRRLLTAYSRYPETPRALLIELTADGTDYRVHSDAPLPPGECSWDVLSGVLADAPYKLTRHDILAQWPTDYDKPVASTLSRQLLQALEAGRVQRDGTGRRNDPFKYWLPGREKAWVDDFGFVPDLPVLPPINDRKLFRLAKAMWDVSGGVAGQLGDREGHGSAGGISGGDGGVAKE